MAMHRQNPAVKNARAFHYRSITNLRNMVCCQIQKSLMRKYRLKTSKKYRLFPVSSWKGIKTAQSLLSFLLRTWFRVMPFSIFILFYFFFCQTIFGVDCSCFIIYIYILINCITGNQLTYREVLGVLRLNNNLYSAFHIN